MLFVYPFSSDYRGIRSRISVINGLMFVRHILGTMLARASSFDRERSFMSCDSRSAQSSFSRAGVSSCDFTRKCVYNFRAHLVIIYRRLRQQYISATLPIGSAILTCSPPKFTPHVTTSATDSNLLLSRINEAIFHHDRRLRASTRS